MATKITRNVLESYLQCRYKGHLKLAGEQGNKSDYELLQEASRNQVRLAAADKLAAKYEESVVRPDLTIAITPGILKQGKSLLLNVALEDHELQIHFDALQRRAGPSRLGDFHYIPVLFDETERPRRHQKDLLDLYGFIIGEFQGKYPSSGVLIYGQGCLVTRIKLNPNAQEIQRVMQEIKEIQSTGTQPQLMLNNHCQVCEFRHRCYAEATAKDDLSLLRGIGEKTIRKYNRRGIFTVTQLSCIFRPPKRRKQSQQKSQPHDPALQALAIRDKKIYVLGTPQLPQASTRIYFDIEGDPERHVGYLLGMIIESNGVEEHHSFWADSPAEECRVFQQFLDVVEPLDDFRIYAYGSYEAAFLRRMLKTWDQPELGEKIMARLVNVLSIVYSHVYFPTYSNSLKDIGRYLGSTWAAADASGLQSVVWRKKWEQTGATMFKETLTTYNMEDCIALRKVTEFLYTICSEQPSMTQSHIVTHPGREVSRVEEADAQSSRRDWRLPQFSVPDFQFINKRAYFDYQRDKVFIRTNKTLKRTLSRRRDRKGKRNLWVNRSIAIESPECPFCRGTDLNRKVDGRLTRLAFDLRVTRSGVRRWVTRFNTTWHWCNGCGRRFLPREYLRLDEHFHSLKSWAMYEHVAHRASFSNITQKLKDYFGLPVFAPDVRTFKLLLSRYYEETYRQLLDKIVSGAIIHADETEVHLKEEGKGYVWVFTNMEEVVFMYRKSREGGFLHDLLKDFRGVLISDFYAPYNSLECEQQKCLIHLMRDFNHDIQGNPWDEELKTMASTFGRLLRMIIATVDQYGLRKQHLEKHQWDVDQFVRDLSERACRSEVAEAYRRRLLQYQDKLFTFLHYDGVPWNNNNAEHAVKRFAYYREVADGAFSEHGLNEYLVLLSLDLTCRYRGVGFLKFLLSQEKDIDAYCASPNQKRPLPTLELCPEGFTFSRRKRKRDWDQG